MAAKDNELTPMMKQFLELKAKHPDAIMLFRCGDFYETYSTDAIVASDILGITLTKRANGKDKHLEMAGFPYHALDTYLPKLVRAGRRVAICHVLRYTPFYNTIRNIIRSGELGEIMTFNANEGVGAWHFGHSFVRGHWGNSEKSTPMILAKCCHDIDFLLWIGGSKCKKVSSFGSLRWFCEKNAPEGSAARCINCQVETTCPYSAVHLYKERKEWIRNFDVPEGKTIDNVIDEELQNGKFGRCVYHCDNDVTDHQVVNMELENETTISFVVNAFTMDDLRATHIKMTHGEIDGNEKTLRVRKFRGNEETVYDFSDLCSHPFHAGADLNIVEEFVNSITRSSEGILSSTIESSIESHVVCYEAETSRLTNQTILID